MSPTIETFETRLLRELQRLVAERPDPAAASAHPRRPVRRRLALAAAGAAVAGAAAVLLASDLGGGPSPAYAVEQQSNGVVTVEINSLRDAAGLERKLNDAGVRAKVDYLEPGTMCREPRFTPARVDGHGRVSAGQRVNRDGSVEFTIDPSDVAADETVVITASSGGPGEKAPSTLSVAMARGEVAPCVPVKDTRPAPPANPKPDDANGPRLERSTGPHNGQPSLQSKPG